MEPRKKTEQSTNTINEFLKESSIEQAAKKAAKKAYLKEKKKKHKEHKKNKIKIQIKKEMTEDTPTLRPPDEKQYLPEEISESDIETASHEKLKELQKWSTKERESAFQEANHIVSAPNYNAAQAERATEHAIDMFFKDEKITAKLSQAKKASEEMEDISSPGKKKKKKKKKKEIDDESKIAEKEHLKLIKTREAELRQSMDLGVPIDIEVNEAHQTLLALEKRKQLLTSAIAKKEEAFKKQYNDASLDKKTNIETDIETRADAIHHLFCQTELATDYYQLTLLENSTARESTGSAFAAQLNAKIKKIVNSIYGEANVKAKKYSDLEAFSNKEDKLQLRFRHNITTNIPDDAHINFQGTLFPKELLALFDIPDDVPQKNDSAEEILIKAKARHTRHTHDGGCETRIYLPGFNKLLAEKTIDEKYINSKFPFPLLVDNLYRICCHAGLFLPQSLFHQSPFSMSDRCDLICSFQEEAAKKEKQVAINLNALLVAFLMNTSNVEKDIKAANDLNILFDEPSSNPFRPIATINDGNICIGIKRILLNDWFTQSSKCTPDLKDYFAGEFRPEDLQKTFPETPYLRSFIQSMRLFEIKLGYPMEIIRNITKKDYAPIWLIVSPKAAKTISNKINMLSLNKNESKPNLAYLLSLFKDGRKLRLCTIPPEELNEERTEEIKKGGLTL